MLFLDFMDGGAWPLLVGELTCHVDSGNERDLHLLISFGIFNFYKLLRGTVITIADSGSRRL